MVIQRSKRTISKAEKSHIQLALITFDSLALQIHFCLGSNNRFDIVGFGQGTHIHAVIYHQKAMFQIGTGKPVRFYFLNISHIHGTVKHGIEDQTNTGFSLAAPADQHKHLLTFGGWNQAVTQILL